MNDGGALLTRQEMWERIRLLARTMPVAAQGLALKTYVGADGEDAALMIALAALTALHETQRQLAEALVRAKPRYFDRGNIIDEG